MLHKGAHIKEIRASAGKKTGSTFSRNTAGNVLETPNSGESQTSRREKPENALQLARALCVLANGGLAQHKPVPPDEDRKQQWRDAAFELFAQSGGPLGRTVSDTFLDAMSGFSETQRIEQECLRLTGELERAMRNSPFGKSFLVERRELIQARVNPASGRVRQAPFAILGRYQTVLLDVLDHRGIDFRRFARCNNRKCCAFYYKPRLSSQACSRQCEDVLMSRAHYQREKERCERARDLHGQGKDVFEIARELRVTLGRVRKYLTS